MFGALLEPSDARKGESYPLTSDSLSDVWRGGVTSSGVVVDEETALTLPALFRGVDNLCSHTAMIPLPVYQQTGPGSRERQRDNPVHWLLNGEFNPEMTAMRGRSTTKLHTVLWGNGVSEIEWNSSGAPVALWPLDPMSVNILRVNGKLLYELLKEDGSTVRLMPSDVIHVQQLSRDGIAGYGLIHMLARENLGAALALAAYVQRFYRNNMQLGAIISVVDAMDEDAKAKFLADLEEDHRGPNNAYRALLLEGDAKVHKLPQDNSAAQMIETMTVNIGDAARWLNVPPPLLYELSDATYSNITELGAWYERFSLGPWFAADEQEYSRKLFPGARGAFFVEYVADALLRANTKDRYEAHGTALDRGWKNIDEVRATENLNPLPDGKGQEYRVPMNTEPVGTKPEEQKKPAGRKSNNEPPEDDAKDLSTLRVEIANANRGAIKDAVDRMNAIAEKALSRARKSGKDLDEWAESFGPTHKARVRLALIPPIEALSGGIFVTFPGETDRLAWDRVTGEFTKLVCEGLLECDIVSEYLHAVEARFG